MMLDAFLTFFETVLFMEPGVHHFGYTSWPKSPWDLPVSTCLVPGLHTCATMTSFYMVLRI